MLCSATLKTDSKNAESVASALNVDNLNSEWLHIETTHNGAVKTKIETNDINTLLSTIDDLISCQMVSESMLKNG